MVDHFSRWPEVIPLKAITAQTVAEAFLTNWISRLGYPKNNHHRQELAVWICPLHDPDSDGSHQTHQNYIVSFGKQWDDRALVLHGQSRHTLSRVARLDCKAANYSARTQDSFQRRPRSITSSVPLRKYVASIRRVIHHCITPLYFYCAFAHFYQTIWFNCIILDGSAFL